MAKKNKRPNAATNIPAQSADFNPDYSSVKADLKRIAMLAGFFFTLLFALKFFLK